MLLNLHILTIASSNLHPSKQGLLKLLGWTGGGGLIARVVLTI